MNIGDLLAVVAAIAFLLILAALLVNIVAGNLLERASYARDFPGYSYDAMVRERRERERRQSAARRATR